MPDVKWIKLSTNMFEDEKIKMIDRQRPNDEMVLLWIFILMESAKSNNADRTFYIENNIRNLAERFGFAKEVVIDALDLFEKYQMIKNNGDFIEVMDFDRYAKLDRECVVNETKMKDLRRVVFERDNFKCVYCGDEKGPFEADHVLPKSRGGLDTMENLVRSCRNCNRSKKDRTPQEWRGTIG